MLIFPISLIAGAMAGFIGNRALSSKKSKYKSVFLKKSHLSQKLPALDEDKEEELRVKKNFLVGTLSVGCVLLGKLHPAFSLLGTLGVFYLSSSTIKRALILLIKKRQISYDFLLSISIIIMFFSAQYFVMALGAWLYFLGSLIQVKAKGESKKALSDLFQVQSEFVWILHDGIEVETPLEQLKKGDVFVINTGEKVLADGAIINGQALVDQQFLTGEFQPAEKLVGDQVLATTVVLSGKIYVCAEKTGDETISAEIRQMLFKAADQKSSKELKGEEWANKSVLPVLGAASISFFAFSPLVGLFVLNSGPGSTVRFIGPLVTLNHLKIAAQSGILIKDGRVLEKLNDIDTILFDKTGTLTTAEPVLESITTFSDETEHEILIYAASAESKLNHPIAHTIIKEAQHRNLDLIPINDSEYKVGLGLTVFINGDIIRVGSPKFIEQEGISLGDVEGKLIKLQQEGHTSVLVSINERLIGALELRAEIRPEAKHLVDLFHSKNIKVHLVSGDQQTPVESLSSDLGMDGCFYEVLPKQKADIVKEFKQKGKKVCFVGDGINDTIAMQTADVSVSLKGASSIATDVADIILMDDSLVKLEKLFKISQSANRHLGNSLKLSVLPPLLNLGGIILIPAFGLASIFTIKTACKIIGLSHAMLCTSLDLEPKKVQENPRELEQKKQQILH